MTTLLLSPASTGKTRRCIERIHALRAEYGRDVSRPFAPVWVILPNQDHVRAFRHRLAERGALGVELGTFYKFYAEILARSGQFYARLTEPLQYRLLQEIVARRYGEGLECYYFSLRDKPGFVAELRELVEELKRARVQPDVFAAAVMGRGARLEELAAIYADYQAWLMLSSKEGLGQAWADAEGQGWLAAIVLEQNRDLCRDVCLLVVDGFDEFNPTQLGVLKALADQVGETMITLTGDASIARERLAHRRFIRARDLLTRSLDVAPTLLSTLHAPRSTFAHLEASLFDSAPRKQLADGAIEFLEAQNRREETRAALRWVKARIVRDGIAPREIAVIARDLDPYLAFLQETASEFGVPLRIAGGLPLASNPCIAALFSLLSLSADGFPRRRVLDAWRSPYFDWSVGQDVILPYADTLDAISHNGLVIRGLVQWREAFDLALSPLAERDQDEAAPTIKPERAADARDKFEAFVARITPPAEAGVRDYVAFVEDLVGDDSSVGQAGSLTYESLSVVARARQNPETAERDVAALNSLKDVLRGLALAESVFETDPRPFSSFLRDLRGVVEATSYEVPVPETETVSATSVLRARGLAFRAVAILGLAEGDFPQAEREDTLLTESDRAFMRKRGLPIESRLRGDEATFFYEAATRASDRLLLCRPYLADDGQPWEASPYWEHARQIVDAPMRHIRPSVTLSIEYDEPASPQEALSRLAGGDLVGGEAIAHGATVLRARLAGEASGPFEGDLSSRAAELTARFPADFVWSASRLESYGTCPMDFWTGVALSLEPRDPPEEGYDVRAFGSMVHAVLEKVYQRVADPSDVKAVLAALPDVARQVLEAAPSDYGFRPTALWRHQRAEIEQLVRKTITALAEESQAYTPRFYEQAFGFKGQPVLNAGDVKLHGFIDRVDAAPDGRLRVMDYKTSSTLISARDLAEGHRLQLPLYALAARDALKLGDVDAGFYWHVGSARPSSLKLESFEGGVEAAIVTAIAYARAYVQAIREGKFSPRVPSGGCPSYCPATAWCWRFSGSRR